MKTLTLHVSWKMQHPPNFLISIFDYQVIFNYDIKDWFPLRIKQQLATISIVRMMGNS